MKQSDVSVVVCAGTDDRWSDLVAALRSLDAQTLPAWELILVIDHNEALATRAALEFPVTRVIRNVRTSGLSGSRNTGVLAASGRVVAFIDDDGVAEPDWIAKLSEYYKRGVFGGRSVLGVGGAVLPEWDATRPGWLPPEFDWAVGCSFRGMPNRVASVRNLIGCNMSFERSVLIAAGGFAESVGGVGSDLADGEETELCIRILERHARGAIVYDPELRVRHRVRPERATWQYFARRCFGEGASKARVVGLRGRRRGLSSEGSYVGRTLPLGMARALAGGERDGIKRALTIPAGLAVTAAGYVRARMPHAPERPDARGIRPLAAYPDPIDEPIVTLEGFVDRVTAQRLTVTAAPTNGGRAGAPAP